MPRKPTGNPTGRPKGSGTLGEVTRFTLRLPTDLYQRLELFAEGRSYTRGTPELSGCVRELLEHALACPYKRQTKSISQPSWDDKCQLESVTESERDEIKQAESVPTSHGEILQQTLSIPGLCGEPAEQRWKSISQPASEQEEPDAVQAQAVGEARDDIRQTGNETPAYDPSMFYLGELCEGRHDFQGTGHTLRSRKRRVCLECDKENARQRRQKAKRQATPA